MTEGWRKEKYRTNFFSTKCAKMGMRPWTALSSYIQKVLLNRAGEGALLLWLCRVRGRNLEMLLGSGQTVQQSYCQIANNLDMQGSTTPTHDFYILLSSGEPG